jgi:fatty acid desaturase
MARDRSRGRKAQKEAALEARVQELRKEARAWYFRAVMAIVAAVALGFLSILLAGVLAAVVGWCVVEGTKLAFEANRLLEQG